MTEKNAAILGIETSCDDTSVAVVRNGKTILANLVSSQVDFHRRFGGVVPEIASRRHLEALTPLIDEALTQAGLGKKELQAVAVTNGPGLVGALLVGVSNAKAFAYGLNIPLVPVNHVLAHIYANFLVHDNIPFPLVALVVSGGHSSLLYLEDSRNIKIIGRTCDDAAGEVFDKIARALNLGYPGGPVIQKLAQTGNPEAVSFPRAYLDEKHLFDFSFSGLKSAVLNYINRYNRQEVDGNEADIAASFQAAVVEVLVAKAIDAAVRLKAAGILLAGGVAANDSLRHSLAAASVKKQIPFYMPPIGLCTDNAAMVAAAAYPLYCEGVSAAYDLNADPSLQL